jgi:hypothetical protein
LGYPTAPTCTPNTAESNNCNNNTSKTKKNQDKLRMPNCSSGCPTINKEAYTMESGLGSANYFRAMA